MGTLVLLGAIIEVALGFQLSGGTEALRGIHIVLGIAGLILVVALTVIAFRAKIATVYSNFTITILTIVVLAQVGIGFQLLNGAEELVLSHEANGFVIVILSLLMGGITFWSAKRQMKAQFRRGSCVQTRQSFAVVFALALSERFRRTRKSRAG